MKLPVAATAILFLVVLGSHAPPVSTPAPPPPAVSFVTFKAVNAPEGGDLAALGRLRWAGGWSLTSNDPRFGGISAMVVEGGEVAAFSDSGWLLRFRLAEAGATVRARVEQLPGSVETPNGKADRDVESMAVAGPLAWVMLERRDMAIRFDRRIWRRDGAAKPKAMKDWPDNNGAEATLRLPDGRFLVFSEGEGGESEALMFLGDPATPGTRAIRMRNRPPAGYRITDAALAPDGRMLLLNRDFNLLKGGFVAKLTAAPVPPMRPGALIEGTEIADLSRPLSDNMEALSVAREGGRTVLWMASDNNYSSVQRTLLLKFVLE
ncbi:MAG TPA: esterase-like activity of phytase family protein [Allosphingosinicella sp.]|jgi:hypothetical protein